MTFLFKDSKNSLKIVCVQHEKGILHRAYTPPRRVFEVQITAAFYGSSRQIRVVQSWSTYKLFFVPEQKRTDFQISVVAIRTASFQSVNSKSFTAVTRVQIPSGTPTFQRTYQKPAKLFMVQVDQRSSRAQ